MKLLSVNEAPVLTTGLVTFSNYQVIDDYADIFLQRVHDMPRDEFLSLVAQLGRRVAMKTYKNKIQNEGLEVFARYLVGDTTYTGELNYGCLGTGTNAVTASDGQLQTEVYRKLYASRTRSGRTVTMDWYFSKSNTNGTYEEFGVVMDGTGTANSGQFYNRVLTGGWVKSASVGMTVSVQFDLEAA
jgi:hypothetical protein